MPVSNAKWDIPNDTGGKDTAANKEEKGGDWCDNTPRAATKYYEHYTSN